MRHYIKYLIFVRVNSNLKNKMVDYELHSGSEVYQNQVCESSIETYPSVRYE